MGRVIHTGQALVDETVEVGRLPRRGANEMAASYARAAGGAVNILLAAVRQGASTVHAGAHGRGSNGDLIREALEAEGVTLASAPVEELDTGICFVMVEPSAERTFVTTLGAERRLTVEMLTASEPVAGDLVCVTGYSLAVASTREPLLEWLATLASGVSVVLDPGDAFAGLDARLRETMLGLTSVWTGNQEESSALTGKTGMAAAAASVVRMLGDGEGPGRVAIVRDGPRGCAVAIGGERLLDDRKLVCRAAETQRPHGEITLHIALREPLHRDAAVGQAKALDALAHLHAGIGDAGGKDERRYETDPPLGHAYTINYNAICKKSP